MEAAAGGSRSSMVVIRFDDSELEAVRAESSAPDAEDMSEIRVSHVEPEQDASEEESEETEAEAGEDGAGEDGDETAPASAEMLDVFDSSTPLPSASGVGVHVDVLRGLASITSRSQRVVRRAQSSLPARACLDKCLRQAGAHTPSSLNGAP